MSHFTHFSVAAREPCTLHCMLLDSNETKCSQEMPPASQLKIHRFSYRWTAWNVAFQVKHIFGQISEIWGILSQINMKSVICTKILHVYTFHHTRNLTVDVSPYTLFRDCQQNCVKSEGGQYGYPYWLCKCQNLGIGSKNWLMYL